ncbi:MAG: hypothetical protein J0H67_23690, partial [Rhodospirillales bacterium]|nr:hypothetical protein [Rhodospirillales bacterium]
MRKVREVLRLKYACGASVRTIARAVGIGHTLSFATQVGPGTAALVETIMRTKPHPEQGFRACLGILRLAKTYGDVRLEA